MTRDKSYRETILPIADGELRPLWSVMIPTYNCAKYLRETLISVLAQDPGSDLMQIEVIDDYSTKDDPRAVVEEVGQGRVNFYRQPKNVGYIKNFNTCLQRSRGNLIHLLHGDDIVRDGFYLRMHSLLQQNSDIGAAFCRHIIVDEQGDWKGISPLEQDESGILIDCLDKIAVTNLLQPPSMVVRRDVYEKLGGFDSRIACCGEDWEMWLRIAAHYSIGYEVEPLAMYRSHSMSITGRCRQTGQNMRDLRKIIDISQSYLPSATSKDLSIKARENWALWSLRWIVPEMLSQGDIKVAIIQIREVLQCSHSSKVIRELLRILWCRQRSFFKTIFRKITISLSSGV